MNNRRNSGTTGTYREGVHVYDSKGDKIGTLISQNGDYIVIEKGWLFPKDYYVPTSVIARTDENDDIFLRQTRDELGQMDLSQPPSQGTYDRYTEGDAATYAASERDTDSTTRTQGSMASGSPTDRVRRGSDRLDQSSDQTINVPIREEELIAEKRQHEAGRVHLHKDVVEEQQTITAPVTHEEVVVHRRPATGDTQAGDDAFTERDIDVPVMGEELVTGKRARTTEEVHLHKRAITEQQQASDTVRKERVTVEGNQGIINESTDDQLDQPQR